MSDIRLLRTPELNYDIDLGDGDFVLTDSLENAVIVSLALWNRKDLKEGVADTESVQGGWFADALEELPIGSRLYKIFSEKLDESALEKAKQLVHEALSWMIADGVAKDVDVSASITGDSSVEFTIIVNKPDGDAEEFKWKTNWEASV